MAHETSPYDELVKRVESLERAVTGISEVIRIESKAMLKMSAAQQQLFRYVSGLSAGTASPVVNVIHEDEHES